MGIIRRENDATEADRIAEYAFKYSDKAVRYAIPDAALVSMKNLLADSEFRLIDKKRYQFHLFGERIAINMNATIHYKRSGSDNPNLL